MIQIVGNWYDIYTLIKKCYENGNDIFNLGKSNIDKNEIKIIQEYLENEDYCHVYDSHFEYMQQQKVNNYIEYEKDFELEDTYCNQLVVTNEKKFSFWRFIIELITRRKHPKSKDKLVEPKQIEQIY